MTEQKRIQLVSMSCSSKLRVKLYTGFFVFLFFFYLEDVLKNPLREAPTSTLTDFRI